MKLEKPLPQGRADGARIRLEPQALDDLYVARIAQDVQPECASNGQTTSLDEADVPIPVTLWSGMTFDSNPVQHQVTRIIVESC